MRQFKLLLPLIVFLVVVIACSSCVHLYDRRGGDLHPLGYWITPEAVSNVAFELTKGSQTSFEKAGRLYSYVTSLNNTPDEGNADFWQLPVETIERGAGDCEDLAFLLHSLFLGADLDSELVFGELAGVGHVWVIYDGRLFEPGRYSYPLPVDRECYSDYLEDVRIKE